MTRSTLKRLAVAAALSIGITGTALAGPPWIAIEYPVNPHNPNTRGAFVTVRTYHHGELVSYGLSGTAEGLVNGQRQSVKLDIRRLPEAGMYAVYWTRPAQGTWALLITSSQDNHFMASVLVQVDNAGRIASVSVPSDSREGGRWLVPRRVANAEIDAALRRSN